MQLSPADKGSTLNYLWDVTGSVHMVGKTQTLIYSGGSLTINDSKPETINYCIYITLRVPNPYQHPSLSHGVRQCNYLY